MSKVIHVYPCVFAYIHNTQYIYSILIPHPCTHISDDHCNHRNQCKNTLLALYGDVEIFQWLMTHESFSSFLEIFCILWILNFLRKTGIALKNTSKNIFQYHENVNEKLKYTNCNLFIQIWSSNTISMRFFFQSNNLTKIYFKTKQLQNFKKR